MVLDPALKACLIDRLLQMQGGCDKLLHGFQKLPPLFIRHERHRLRQTVCTFGLYLGQEFDGTLGQ
jgi:hypothetical protein